MNASNITEDQIATDNASVNPQPEKVKAVPASSMTKLTVEQLP